MAKYERAYFPMKYLNLSQGYGADSYTHKYSYAFDLCGKDSGKDEVYAPFNCKVTKVYCPAGRSYEVWLVSTNKVLCSNGYYGILTMSITHPTEIKNMRVGQTFKQNELICHEGREGGATGNHIHLELSKGNCPGWDVINGNYVNKNKIKPEEYLFATDDSIIMSNTYKGRTYNFRKEKDMVKVVSVSDSLVVHKTKDFNSSSAIGELANGTEVIHFYTEGSFAYIYSHGLLGYVSKNYIK